MFQDFRYAWPFSCGCITYLEWRVATQGHSKVKTRSIVTHSIMNFDPLRFYVFKTEKSDHHNKKSMSSWVGSAGEKNSVEVNLEPRNVFRVYASLKILLLLYRLFGSGIPTCSHPSSLHIDVSHAALPRIKTHKVPFGVTL